MSDIEGGPGLSDASSVSGSPGLFSDLSGAGISNSESDLDGGPGLQVGPEAVVVDEAVAALAVDPGFAGSAGGRPPGLVPGSRQWRRMQRRFAAAGHSPEDAVAVPGAVVHGPPAVDFADVSTSESADRIKVWLQPGPQHVNLVDSIGSKLRNGPAFNEKIANTFELLTGTVARHHASLVAEAERLDIHRTKLPDMTIEIAATVYETSVLATEAGLDELYQRVTTMRDVELIAGYTYVSNDEATFMLNLPEDLPPDLKQIFKKVERIDGTSGVHGPVAKYVCHVMNSTAMAGFLLKCVDGSFLYYMYPIPTRLMTMDHTNSKTTLESMKRALSSPALKRLLEICPFLVAAVTNDDCNTNKFVDKVCRHVALINEARIRSRCDVHMCHTCTGNVLDCVKLLLSGIIAFGLAMRQPGSLNILRRCLRLYFAVCLRVSTDPAPGPDSPTAKYMDYVLDLFLHPSLGKAAGVRRQVIRKLLNGVIMANGIIWHHCVAGCCPGDTTPLVQCQVHLVDALLPHLCPILRKGRWTAIQDPLNYLGLLFALGIAQIVLPIWLRELKDPSKPATELDFAPSGESRLALGAFMQPIVDLDDLGEPGIGGDEVPDDQIVACDEPEDGENTGKEYAAENERNRATVQDLLDSQPMASLIVLRRSLQPFFWLMASLLHMASTKFDRKQYKSMKEGKPMDVKLRLVEQAKGTLARSCLDRIRRRLTDVAAWGALPAACRTAETSFQAFRMLLRGGASVFLHLLWFHTMLYPSKAFRLVDPDCTQEVAEEIYFDRECLWDHYMQAHRLRFPDDKLFGIESLTIILVVAMILKNETVNIELLHAALRRFMIGSVQAKKRSWSQVSADWVLSRQRASERGQFAEHTPYKSAKESCKGNRGHVRPQKQPNKKSKRLARHLRAQRRRGISGRKHLYTSWTEFLKDFLKGVKESGKRINLASAAYKALSAARKRALAAQARRKNQRNRARAFLRYHGHRADDAIPNRPADADVFADLGVLAVRDETTLLQSLSKIFDDSGGKSIQAALATANSFSRRQSQYENQSEKRENQEVREYMAAVPPEVLGPPQVRGRIATTSWRNFPAAWPAVVFCPPVISFAEHLYKRMPQKVKKAVSTMWHHRCAMIISNDLAELPKPPDDKYYDCKNVGICTCKTGPWPYLRNMFARYASLTRTVFPPKTNLRKTLSEAEIVIRIYQYGFPLNSEWFLVAYINLATMVSVLVPLCLEASQARVDRTIKDVLLTLADDFEYLLVWKFLTSLDANKRWMIDFWQLRPHFASFPPNRVRGVRVTGSHVLWLLGPRPSAPPSGALPPPGPGAAPLGLSPADARGPDDGRDGVAPLPLEDAPPERPEEAEPECDGPAKLIPEEIEGPSASDDEYYEPPDLAGLGLDAAPAGAAAAGPKGKGRGMGGTGRVRAAPKVYARDAGWLAEHGRDHYHAESVWSQHTRIEVGHIVIYEAKEQLIYVCNACRLHFHRKYEAAKIHDPTKDPQGRPMGLLIAVSQFNCRGDKARHRFFIESGVDYLTRWMARRFALRHSVAAECFKKERKRWDHEGDEPRDSPGGV